MANGTFGGFASALEGIHNSGHVWVSGSMGIVPTAPADPAFWTHHAKNDRIWAKWQVLNPGQNPPLAGAASVMDPGRDRVRHTRHDVPGVCLRLTEAPRPPSAAQLAFPTPQMGPSAMGERLGCVIAPPAGL